MTKEYIFQPTSKVLAKLKGFSPWPGMIIPEEIIPQDILTTKPRARSKRQAAVAAAAAIEEGASGEDSDKGDAKEVVENFGTKYNLFDAEPSHYCVRFFKDDNYMWATKGDLKELTEDMIETFVNRQRKESLLKEAYLMAKEEVNVAEFVKHGSKNVVEEEEEEEEEEEDEEEEVKPQSRKRSSARSRTQPPSKKAAPAKKTASAKKSAPKKKAPSKTPPRTRTRDPTPEEDEDYEEEIDEYAEDVDWATFGDEDTFIVDPKDIPSSKQVAKLHKELSPIVADFKLTLLNTFMDEEIDSDRVLEARDMLKEFESQVKYLKTELGLLSKYNIESVISGVLSREGVENRFRKRLEKIYLTLFGFEFVEPERQWTYEGSQPEPAPQEEEAKEEQVEQETKPEETEVQN